MGVIHEGEEIPEDEELICRIIKTGHIQIEKDNNGMCYGYFAEPQEGADLSDDLRPRQFSDSTLVDECYQRNIAKYRETSRLVTPKKPASQTRQKLFDAIYRYISRFKTPRRKKEDEDVGSITFAQNDADDASRSSFALVGDKFHCDFSDGGLGPGHEGGLGPLVPPPPTTTDSPVV
ncbi:hypothetical protein BDP27DRAFT_323907 [Rhodocollybia butyracea]|uniref:Uncharacterized protein n=1 Tax=Rhodocollybia butyracea TaxID=206335 RepID=A0A9P5U1M3_9AGAR|nr:hypothetical protein BDP27DRAFT_323907 [Rhodocollybia butyracea]